MFCVMILIPLSVIRFAMPSKHQLVGKTDEKRPAVPVLFSLTSASVGSVQASWASIKPLLRLFLRSYQPRSISGFSDLAHTNDTYRHIQRRAR